MAKIVDAQEFFAFISSPNRPTLVNWRNSYGIPLTSTIRSSAVVQATNCSELVDETFANADEILDETANLTINISDEDNAFFDNSCSILNTPIKNDIDKTACNKDVLSRISSGTIVVGKSSKPPDYDSSEKVTISTKPTNDNAKSELTSIESKVPSINDSRSDASRKNNQARMPKIVNQRRMPNKRDNLNLRKREHNKDNNKIATITSNPFKRSQ